MSSLNRTRFRRLERANPGLAGTLALPGSDESTGGASILCSGLRCFGNEPPALFLPTCLAMREKCPLLCAILAALLSLSGLHSKVLADDGAKPAANKSDDSAAIGTAQYVQKALVKVVDLTVMDASLADVLKELGRQAGVTIHLDQSALDAVGLFADDLKVSKNLKGLSLRSVLRHVLGDFELTFMYYEGVLLITTPEQAEAELVVMAYDVVDLIGAKGARPEDYDYDSLIELIATTVAPDSWDAVGGPGSISAYRGTIIVSQTSEIHEQIAGLLSATREAKKIAAEHPDRAPPVVSVAAADAVRARENGPIEQALNSTAAFEFEEEPLANVAAALSRDFKIPVEINDRHLDLLGVGADTPVTILTRNLTLRQALRLMLRDLELTFRIADGVLIITIPEDYEQNQVTRTYPVLDLVDVDTAVSELSVGFYHSSDYDYPSLIELTKTTIAPTTWDEVGGPGSLAVMEAHGILVITQTPGVHEQIEHLYTTLRQTVPEKAKRVARTEDDGPVRMAFYRVPTYRPKDERKETKPDDKAEANGNVLPQVGFGADYRHGSGPGFGAATPVMPGPYPDEAELLDLITTLIEPESWQSRDDVMARAVTGRLIIRHTESVHRQIRELGARLAIPYFSELTKSQTQPFPRLSGGFF